MAPGRIETIRENYDRIAAEYARHIFNELDNKPLDRQILIRFAEATRDRGEVCDMGCGPGHVARFLYEHGARVSGLDLSSQMVEQARKLSPGLTFREGNMLDSDLADSSLAGITAFYAIVNIPRESLPRVFSEMHRVLAPGGLLLLAFHIGDEVLRPEELWGQKVSMEFNLLPPAVIADLLTETGFEIEEVIERPPYAPEIEYQSHRAYIFACKPRPPTD